MADFELMPSSELWARNPAAGAVSGLRPRKEVEKEKPTAQRHHKEVNTNAVKTASKMVELLLWHDLRKFPKVW